MSPEPKRDEDLTPVWAEYKRTGDELLRNRLVERYLYLVKVIGPQFPRRGQTIAEPQQQQKT